MNFTLRRTLRNSSGIYGKFLSETFGHLCVTLERNFDGSPKIPVGQYRCIRRMSPHFGYEVFMLEDVPGHDHIEIHKANVQTELDGCIALGMHYGATEGITSSKIAFDKFMSLQEGCNEFYLTVEYDPNMLDT